MCSRFYILIVLVLLTSCGRVDRFWAGATGKPIETCYEGITYLQFTSGAAVMVDKDGKPVGCR
jgi:hypothetical protein